jgi:O-antigen/teichoic acid export membrane protein
VIASRTWLSGRTQVAQQDTASTWIARTGQMVAGQSVVQVFALFTGLLLVRWMDKSSYAEYTLASSALAFLNASTDLGLSSAIVGLGGRCYADGAQLSRLIDGALAYRRLLLLGCAPVLLTLLPLILNRHGWTGPDVWLIALLVLLSSWIQGGAVIYGSVLKLQYAVMRIQAVDITANVVRMLSVLLLGSGRISVLAALSLNLLGSTCQFAGNRLQASPYLAQRAAYGTRERTMLWDFTRPLIAANLFYAAQGQIAIWMVGIFAAPAAIAEVGALARLGQVILFLNMCVTLMVHPYLARIQDTAVYRTRAWQIGALEASAASMLIFSAWLLPGVWLQILGPKYLNLQHEVALAITLSALLFVGDACYFSLIARCHTTNQWLRIPVTITGIVAGALISPPVTTYSAVVFQYYALLPYAALEIALLTKYLRRA